MELAPLLLWKDRTRSLNDEELQSCQGKPGELSRVATVSRPNICVHPARLSANLNNLQVIDIYRTNDLIKPVKHWQGGCSSKYPAGLSKTADRSPFCLDYGWGKARPIYQGTMMLVG